MLNECINGHCAAPTRVVYRQVHRAKEEKTAIKCVIILQGRAAFVQNRLFPGLRLHAHADQQIRLNNSACQYWGACIAQTPQIAARCWWTTHAHVIARRITWPTAIVAVTAVAPVKPKTRIANNGICHQMDRNVNLPSCRNRGRPGERDSDREERERERT